MTEAVESTDEDLEPSLLELDGPEAERLAHLASLITDLTDARRIVEILLEELAHPAEADIESPENERRAGLTQGLYTAALISYARAFASGRRTGLSEQDFAEFGPLVLATHRYFMKVRNQHIAHQVLPFEEVRVGIFVNADRTRVDGVAHFSIKRITDDVQGVQALLGLIDIMVNRLVPMYNEQSDLVLAHAQGLEPSDLAALPDAKIVVQAVDVPATPPAS